MEGKKLVGVKKCVCKEVTGGAAEPVVKPTTYVGSVFVFAP